MLSHEDQKAIELKVNMIKCKEQIEQKMHK